MFKLSTDSFVNFRGIQTYLSELASKVGDIYNRLIKVEREVRNISTVTSSSSSTVSGEVVQKEITQASHGLVIGNTVHLNSGTWEKADADTADKVCDGIVSDVADANTFTVAISGWMTATTGEWDALTGGSGGLTAGEYYWLSSTAGGLTKTQPSSGLAQLVLTAVSATIGIVTIGDVVDMDASGGGSGSSYFPSGW